MVEMIQVVITYILVIAAFGYAAYGLYKILSNHKDKDSGCASGCNCDAVKLRKELAKNKK